MPTSIPMSSRRVGFTPNGKFMAVTMIGMIAMYATMTPDATVCSEYAVKPMPLTSSNVPMIAAFRHSTSVGNARPRSLSQTMSTRPATRNREPIW